MLRLRSAQVIARIGISVVVSGVLWSTVTLFIGRLRTVSNVTRVYLGSSDCHTSAGAESEPREVRETYERIFSRARGGEGRLD